MLNSISQNMISGTDRSRKLSEYRGSIPVAIAAISATECTFIIDIKPDDLAAPIEVPSNIHLDWRNGCVVGGTATITFAGTISAGNYQLFGSGITISGRMKAPRIEWWKDTSHTDWTEAIQAAINSSEGSLSINSGSYTFGDITIPDYRSGFSLHGQDRISTMLIYTGTGTAISGSVSFLNISDIAVWGSPTSPLLFDIGTTCITSTGVITMQNTSMRKWGTILEWSGGYYDKFENCDFAYFDTLGNNVNGNNMAFIGCKASYFNTGVKIIGGTGDFIWQSGSIEVWSGKAFTQSSGSECSITIRDTYFETLPYTDNTGTGLDDFGAAVIMFVAKGEHTLSNNNIQTKGIFRGVYGASIAGYMPVSVLGHGNKWITSSTASNDLQYAYFIGGPNIGTVSIKDVETPTEAGHTLAYVKTFVTSLAGASNADGYDAFTYKGLRTGWITPTLLNGWVGVSTSTATFRYRIHNGVLYMSGVLDGSAATSGTVCNFELGNDVVSSSGFYWITGGNTTISAQWTGRILTANNELLMSALIANIIVSEAIPLE